MFSKVAKNLSEWFGIRRYPDGTSTLLGQRFHSVIAYMYFGLGWIMATSFAGWFPEAVTGRSAFGLIVFFAAWAWILWLRFRTPRRDADA